MGWRDYLKPLGQSLARLLKAAAKKEAEHLTDRALHKGARKLGDKLIRRGRL